jgi:hypothetical protein
MRRLNLMLFVIVVAIIIFSLVRAVSGTLSQQKRHEPKRNPATSAQVAAQHG